MPALGLWAEADLASSVCCTAQRPRAGIFRHIQSITYKYFIKGVAIVTVQLRFQILNFNYSRIVMKIMSLPHAYRMWDKNSFNKSVIDFMLCRVIIWIIFRHLWHVTFVTEDSGTELHKHSTVLYVSSTVM